MWYVYIIRSVDFPEQEYIGATADLKRRISDHNAGKSTHTAKFKPWVLGSELINLFASTIRH
jgi:putative endonuclease